MRNRISENHLGKDIFYFAMDEKIKSVLINEYSVDQNNVRILNPDVMDPKDCPLDTYRQCRDLILASIEEIDPETVLQ